MCKVQEKNSKISKTMNGRIIMQSKCAACWIKKSRFVKKQDAKRLQSNLEIKTPLTEIQLLGVQNEWNCEQIFIGRW